MTIDGKQNASNEACGIKSMTRNRHVPARTVAVKWQQLVAIVGVELLGTIEVFELRRSALCVAAIVGAVAIQPIRVSAQWWSRAPADFEDCAAAADKGATQEDKTAALAQCNAKFAGRRKPGGGYTYYDFMQDRSFDIAGPNPTAEEQRHIDEQYTVYLDNQRRNNMAAAFAAKQQEQRLQQASLKSDAGKVPLPQQRPARQQASGGDIRTRLRPGECPMHSFSCEWPRLSEGLNGLKKLFTPSPSKAKKS
jgi:hypothetical protein